MTQIKKLPPVVLSLREDSGASKQSPIMQFIIAAQDEVWRDTATLRNPLILDGSVDGVERSLF